MKLKYCKVTTSSFKFQIFKWNLFINKVGVEIRSKGSQIPKKM